MTTLRRYGYYPGEEVLSQIEGVVVVDLPPPGSISGVDTGTVCVVGEFADMTYATQVVEGAVTDKFQPTQVYSAQDFVNKFGPFDSTLGQFGGACGNGYVAVKGKAFSKLICVPVNLCSSYGVRVYRDLPTNKTVTDPTPVVPMAAGVVQAGREFSSSGTKARIAQRVVFTNENAYITGVDGSVTAVGAPSTAAKTFTSAGSTFVTDGVAVGDILVVGVIGAAGANGSNAATYRVVAISSETAITVVPIAGTTSWDWTTGGSLVFRLHVASTADTGENYALTADAVASVRARATTGFIAAATRATPTTVPAAASATTWDSLSGLNLMTTPNVAGLAYTAATQAANVANSSTMSALYDDAIQSLVNDSDPVSTIDVVIAARASEDILVSLRAMVTSCDAQGMPRMIVVSPSLGSTADTTGDAVASAYPGVGAYRNERTIYAWPPVRFKVTEAVGTSIALASGATTTDGVIDGFAADWVAAVLSNLPAERNPGQTAAPVPQVLSPILGFASNIGTFTLNDYITLKQYGICSLKIDKNLGPIIQSGITTSLTTGEKNINRRRMADFIEQSIALRLLNFTKLPLTPMLKASITGEVVSFLDGLLSEGNPAAQRIAAYEVDPKSGNTPALEALGIFVLIVRVQTLSSADVIVLQAEVGESVSISAA